MEGEFNTSSLSLSLSLSVLVSLRERRVSTMHPRDVGKEHSSEPSQHHISCSKDTEDISELFLLPSGDCGSFLG